MASAHVFLPPIRRFQWLLSVFLPPFGTRKPSSFSGKGSDRLKVKTIPLTFTGLAGAYAASQQQCSTITNRDNHVSKYFCTCLMPETVIENNFDISTIIPEIQRVPLK
ncbi:hypothetical protein V6N13_057832 [Hibiscus sabdariffa]